MSRNKNALKRATMSGISYEDDDNDNYDSQQQEFTNTTSESTTTSDHVDEQLKEQELFLKQQAKPSVHVKKSKFAMEREQRAAAQNSEPPKNILRIFNNTNIVERDISKNSVIIPSLPSQPIAFPTLKQPTLTFLGRRKKQDENLLQQPPKEVVNQTTTTTIVEKSTLEKPTIQKISEEDSIDRESDKMISEMSKEEIEEAQKQILKQFDPSLIDMLKNRGLKKKQSKEKSKPINPKDITITKPSVKMSQEEKNEIIEKDINEIIDKIKHSLNPNELKNTKEEDEKLKWIVGGQEIIAESEVDKKDTSKFKPLRFDLDGNVIDKTKEYHAQSGLYHHGGDQSEAGYTLLEIFQLIRSSVVNQRIINIKLLSSIIKKTDEKESLELIEYLETKYELLKTVFWFGYADAIYASPTVLHKNLNLITVTSDLIRTIFSTCYLKQDGIIQSIEKYSFDFNLRTLNNSISEKVDLIKKYEKDITLYIIADLVSILECEDDVSLLECVAESLEILARYSLAIASKIAQEMLKKFAFNRFDSSLFYNAPKLATNYAKICSRLASHGKNICERIIKGTNIVDISKQYLTLCLSEQKNQELYEFCNELLSFIVTCTSYKIISVMHLFCQEMFPSLVTIIQMAFKKNHHSSAVDLSKHCLFLLQVYMESKSALSFPAFEDKDEVDENSIGHLENFILEDCPLLAVKALKNGMDSLCIRFLYFICTFYDNFYCNPNSDFTRFISNEEIDTSSHILMVMKRVENKMFYQELYNWMESSLNELDRIDNNNSSNFEIITNLLSNITSVITICYFSSKSFKHLFGLLFGGEIHFETLLLRIYNTVFNKYLSKELFYNKSATSQNPLRYKYFMLRERFFNMTYYFLKLYSYEKTMLQQLVTPDQICNLALFSSSILEPSKIRGDRKLFFYILQTFVLYYHPTLLHYLDKDLFEEQQNETSSDNEGTTNNSSQQMMMIESNNVQVIGNQSKSSHQSDFSTSPSDWIYKSIEYYYINRLDETKNIGLIVDTLKFVLTLTYGPDYKNEPKFFSADELNQQLSYMHTLYPKVIQFANIMKIFLMDSEIFFIDSVQQLLQTWIDNYFKEQYLVQRTSSSPYSTNPFRGFSKMENMEDIFFQMFKDFIEQQTSTSFNQPTFAQYVLSFFVHTNIWSSKYRNHIVNELTLKQIRVLNIDNATEWIDRLSVFPHETNLDLIVLYLKRFLAVISDGKDLDSFFIFKYMAYQVYSCLPSLSSEWSIEEKSIISILFESVNNETVRKYILSGLAQKNNYTTVEQVVERLKERKLC